MASPLHTPVCDLLGCRYPIVLAGMGGVARSELVAAVTEAGGYGFLGMVREPPELIETEVGAVRRAGHSRFGVNLIPAATEPDLLEREVATCIALQVPSVCLFWDISEPLVRRLREAGVMVVYQVGSIEEGKAAVGAGAQILIAQGVEAGGHVRGDTPLHQLLPGLVSAFDVPVLAAGGIAGGDDIVTALALGAQGVVIGTAMIPTRESFAHDVHKERLLAAASADTALTEIFHINWPNGAKVRVLETAVTRGERGRPDAENRTVIGWEGGRPIYLFSTDSPLRSMTGEYEAMALYAGAGVGRVTKMTTAGRRLARLVEDAEGLLGGEAHHEDVHLSSPVCYAGINPEYDGYLGHDALVGRLEELRHLAFLALVAADRDRTAKVGYARWVLALGTEIETLGKAPGRPTPITGQGEAGAGARLIERAEALRPLVFEERIRNVLAALLRAATTGPLALEGAGRPRP